MRKTTSFLLSISFVVSSGFSAWGADVWRDALQVTANRLAAREFVRLPDGVRFPEGITANPGTGEIFVGTFDFGGNNKLLRYSRRGKLLAVRDFGDTPLLGIVFNPWDNRIYLCNTGALVGKQSLIQRIDADFDETTPVENVLVIPAIGPPPDRSVGNPDVSMDRIIFGNNAAAPNALAFRGDGTLFVSDSFQGAIFQIEGVHLCDISTPCSVATVKHDGLFATAGFPPFGANGIALSPDEMSLFLANTGDDRVLRMDLATGDIEIFAESINGADGIAFDRSGKLWVAANQADEVVVLNGNGRVVEKKGDFFGIGRDGTPRGLLFPASIVFSGRYAFVTNLALPLTPAVGDEPEEEVTVFTISRIRVR